MTENIKKINKKYNIILADPAWRFETWGERGKDRSAEMHYSTMSVDDIKKLPVQKLADKNCALFIWATSPMLPQALDVVKSWGFTYKTVAFVWIKKGKTGGIFEGLGFWTRLNAEYCLLATRGKPKRISSNVSQIVISKIREHSRKPDEVRTSIVRLLGDLPRIELFARQHINGWDAWGDEAPDQIQKTIEE